MAEMEDLYQEIILDHHKRPRNQRAIVEATHRAKGYNPLCGDEVEIYLFLKDGVVADVSFQGQGCAICMASASILTQHLRGCRLEHIAERYEQVSESLIGDASNENSSTSLDKELQALIAVKRFPARIRCAILPWRALAGALHGQNAVTSE